MSSPDKLFIKLPLAAFLFCFIISSGWADYINGDIEVIYKPEVIDLRPNQGFNRGSGDQTGGGASLSDLEIGSIFIDPAGDVLKVTDI